MDGSYIVVFKASAGAASTETASREQRLGFKSKHRYGRALKGFSAKLSPGQVKQLRADPDVDFVSPNRWVKASGFVPLVSGDSTPFGVRRILAGTPTSAREASGVNVAVIDTGIKLSHTDLNAVHGTNCITPGTPADDDEGHGTHVAGTIAAKNNGSGLVGVAPGTRTYAVKVLDSNGDGTTASVVCGIDWVTTNHAALDIDVANMSLGGLTDIPVTSCASTTDAEHAAICASTTAGVNYVVAAGNSSWEFDHAELPDVPAAYPQVLTVSAITDSDGAAGGTGAPPGCWPEEADDTPASFSNFALTPAGEAHTIAAPGTCISSTSSAGGNETMSGTSMASPHMAGVVARCINEGGIDGPCSTRTPSEVISFLRAKAAGYDGANPGYGFTGDPTSSPGNEYYGFLTSPFSEAAAPPNTQTGTPGGTTTSGSGTAPTTTTATFTPIATPAAPAKANLSRAKRSIRVRRGRFTYVFRARAGLRGSSAFKSIKAVRVSARRKVTLARKSFTVPSSGKVTLRIKLSRKSLRILKRNRRIKLRVTVKLRNAAGLSSTATRTLTLRI